MVIAPLAREPILPDLREARVTEDGSQMCSYAGYEFGAGYPDSVCIDGRLWDADSYEDGYYTSGGELACPRCNTKTMIVEARRDAGDGSCGMSMNTPWCEATLWEATCARALSENKAVAEQIIADIEPFEITDWPDRNAVYEGRASWEATVNRVWNAPDFLRKIAVTA